MTAASDEKLSGIKRDAWPEITQWLAGADQDVLSAVGIFSQSDGHRNPPLLSSGNCLPKFCRPFRATIPGTDTYTDQLW